MIKNPSDNQEVFEFIVAHLLTQKEKSLDEKGIGYRYRGENGLKCAVGAIIPDEDYDLTWEGCALKSPLLLIKPSPIDSYLDNKGYDRDLLSDLQFIHDVFDVSS